MTLTAVPVIHPSLSLVCKRLEDFLLIALRKLRHPVDEGCHEYKPNERIGSVLIKFASQAMSVRRKMT